MFRQAAVAAHHGLGEESVRLPRPSKHAWGLLVVITSFVVSLVAGAALASVEVTVKAAGVLRVPEGLRSIEAAIGGAVSEVLVTAGQYVSEGQTIARLDAAQLKASVAARTRELEIVRRDNEQSEETDSHLAERTRGSLRSRREVLHRRGRINKAQLAQRAEKLQRVREMVQLGAASQDQELIAVESHQAALVLEQELQSELSSIQLQIAEVSNQLESQRLQRRSALSRANSALDEVQSLLGRTDIQATATGRLEALLIQVGSVVQPGQKLAQVVPAGALQSIVAFLPSREIAFVAEGSTARVELESLPVGEFGTATATVTRVSSDIAKPEELVVTFGEALPGSFVRVELELQSEENSPIAEHLRSGEHVLVRLHRRERRVLSLVFDFAREWLER